MATLQNAPIPLSIRRSMFRAVPGVSRFAGMNFAGVFAYFVYCAIRPNACTIGGGDMRQPTGRRSPGRRNTSLVALLKTRSGLAALAALGVALALAAPVYLYPLVSPGSNTARTARAGMAPASMAGGAIASVPPSASRPPARIAGVASRLTLSGAGAAQGPLAPATTGQAQAQVPMTTPTPAAGLEQQTVDLINQRRILLGLNPLVVDSHLVSAARRHSNDIGPHGLCQHEGTDGTSPWDRIDQSGYTGFGNGEVVGCGYNSPLGVVDAWWNSPGHHDILVAPDTNDIGCGWWLDPQGYGWQTCDTGISDRPTPTRSTSSPTATPTPALTGHVTWQGRPPQPSALQQSAITLTLRSGSRTVNYPLQNTDANGYFTVSAAGLPNGTYTWRAKGPQFLAGSGSVTLSGARVTNLEMGMQRAGDANNDNQVNVVDLSILKLTLSRRVGEPGYDSRADFNGDNIVTSADFVLLRLNFGQSGSPPVGPDTP